MTAPKEKREIITCNQKKRYSDEFVARAVGASLSVQFSTAELYMYKCSNCRGYHITRQNSYKGKRNIWIFNYTGFIP